MQIIQNAVDRVDPCFHGVFLLYYFTNDNYLLVVCALIYLKFWQLKVISFLHFYKIFMICSSGTRPLMMQVAGGSHLRVQLVIAALWLTGDQGYRFYELIVKWLIFHGILLNISKINITSSHFIYSGNLGFDRLITVEHDSNNVKCNVVNNFKNDTFGRFFCGYYEVIFSYSSH